MVVEPKNVADSADAILDLDLSQKKYGHFRKVVPGVFADIAKMYSFWKTKDLDLSPIHLGGEVVGLAYCVKDIKQRVIIP